MPIDIASGVVSLAYQDLAVPGKVALGWDRRYSTAFLERAATPFGLGWTNRYFSTLTVSADHYAVVTAEGATESLFDAEGVVRAGGVIRQLGAFLELFQDARRYVVQTWNVESGEVLRYCFEPGAPASPWTLSSIEDVTGQGVDVIWDDRGRLASVRQRLERRALMVEYNAAGFVEGVYLQRRHGRRHRVYSYEYDDAGRQTAAIDAAGFADRFEYDRDGRLTREIGRDGGVFRYRYDEKSRCVLRSGLDRYNEKRLRYVEGIRTTEVVDSCGRRSIYECLPSGQVVRETDPLGGTRSTEYDEHGRISATTDPTGAVTRFAYEEGGNRSSVTDALGHATAVTFNAQHQPLTMTDAAGQVWRRAYDGQNRLIETADPLGNRWRFGYDADGNVNVVADPAGAARRLKYKDGILAAATDWSGNATHYKYDAFGRVIQRAGPLGGGLSIRYDALGNPIALVYADGTTRTASYDAARNLTSLTDENGHATRWRFGSCQRLLDRINRVGGSVSYVWGSEPDQLVKVVNENGDEWTFARDELGRVVEEKEFNGRVRRFGYDASSRCISITQATGDVVRLRRDAAGRLVEQVLPDGTSGRFDYDALGNLVRAANADADVRLERDPLGRVLRETAGEHWVETRYDASGNIAQTTTSVGSDVRFRHDANGMVVGISALENQSIELTRNALGQEVARTMPGGVRMEHRYDRAGRLIAQVVTPDPTSSVKRGNAGGTRDIVNRSYAYDRAGSLTSTRDSRWGEVSYEYDPAERIVRSMTTAGRGETFEYDAAGNITRSTSENVNIGEHEHRYVPGNLLVQKGDISYAYDECKRLVTRSEGGDDGDARLWRYQWDALDQLRVVVGPDGQQWSYHYDALGRRVAKTGPPGRSCFVWDGDVVAHELSPQGKASSWIFDTRTWSPIATIQDGRLFSVVNDQIGTPREILDSFGEVVWDGHYTAWGETPGKKTVSEIECPIRFLGQWHDSESGLSYNRNRYYDPATARYISPDPLGVFAGSHQYRYATNAVNWVDPMGLCPDDPHAEDRKAIPDDHVVVRGGVVTEEQVRKGSGVVIDASGRASGVSVNTGATVAAATTPVNGRNPVPHGQVGATTAGEIRAAGGRVSPDPTPNPNNPTHAEVSGIAPDTLSGLFNQERNPNPRPK